MAWRRTHAIAAAALAGGALVWAGREAWSGRRPLVAAPIVVREAYVRFADTLRRHETLSALLERAGITQRDHPVLLAAATALPARRLRPGLVVHFRRLRTDSVPHQIMVRSAPERRVWLERRADTAWAQRVEEIPWRPRLVRVSGTIESSLYEALDQAVADSVLPAGERTALAWAIADVYDWEIDFTHDVRPGDRFDVLFERLESDEAERRFGRILAARVNAARMPNYAFFFEAAAGRGAFYDEKGRSLRRAFLRAPLQFRRVSSRFGGRLHPILKEWRNHRGIDYAAAPGTPVRATADGIVTRSGREGGYGNMVELRHVNGIRTRYGHLSRFAPGVRVGTRVTQGQTIGQVGSTGLSTGPHLHYEFLVNGRPTNPQRKDMGGSVTVPQTLRAAFDTTRVHLLARLEPGAAIVVRVD